MRGLGTAAASTAVVLLCCAGGANAADLPAKAPAYKAPGDNTCTSIVDFFTTACQLSAYGVRFYGQIDVGFGYETHAAAFDRLAGVNFGYLGKMSSGPKWLFSPNGLGPTNLGFQIKEPLGAGWSFVGQVEAAFMPGDFPLLNGSHSVYTAVNTPLIKETAIGDSNSQGKFYNGLGFVGLSNDTYGTLTFFRQNGLGQDLALAYDPMGVAPSLSVLGFFGAFAGGGDTQNRKDTTAIKYRINIANWHFGAYGQVGGYDEGNGAKGSVAGDIGADFNVGPGIFSADVVAGWRKSAVSLGLSGAQDPTTGLGDPNGTQTMTATISNNTDVIIGAKYQVDRLKLYAGYELISYKKADDTYANLTGFTDIGGDFVCAGCQKVNFTNISTTGFDGRRTQLAWFGGRYALTDKVDVAAAYYHVWQNDFSNGAATPGSGKNGIPLLTCAVSTTAVGSCAGTQDSVSALIDWKFAPKWDTYIATLYSRNNGGLVSGFLAKDDWGTSMGVRFRW